MKLTIENIKEVATMCKNHKATGVTIKVWSIHQWAKEGFGSFDIVGNKNNRATFRLTDIQDAKLFVSVFEKTFGEKVTVVTHMPELFVSEHGKLLSFKNFSHLPLHVYEGMVKQEDKEKVKRNLEWYNLSPEANMLLKEKEMQSV